jgi:hypothetical protein
MTDTEGDFALILLSFANTGWAIVCGLRCFL